MFQICSASKIHLITQSQRNSNLDEITCNLVEWNFRNITDCKKIINSTSPYSQRKLWWVEIFYKVSKKAIYKVHDQTFENHFD